MMARKVMVGLFFLAVIIGLSFTSKGYLSKVQWNKATVAYELGYQYFPYAIYDGSKYIVTYSSSSTGVGGSDSNIYVRIFDGSWNMIKEVQVTDYGGSFISAVVYANNNYYVLFHYVTLTSEHNIAVKQFTSDWSPGTEYQILSNAGVYENHPSCVFVNDYFYVSYTRDYDVLVAVFDTGWSLQTTYTIASTSSNEGSSYIYYDPYNSHFYIAYVSEENGNPDIFVKEYDSSWNLIDRYTIESSTYSQGDPSITSDENHFYVVYSSDETGTNKIYIKVYDRSWNFIDKIGVTTMDTDAQVRSVVLTTTTDLVIVYDSTEGGDLDIFAKYAPLSTVPEISYNTIILMILLIFLMIYHNIINFKR